MFELRVKRTTRPATTVPARRRRALNPARSPRPAPRDQLDLAPLQATALKAFASRTRPVERRHIDTDPVDERGPGRLPERGSREVPPSAGKRPPAARAPPAGIGGATRAGRRGGHSSRSRTPRRPTHIRLPQQQRLQLPCRQRPLRRRSRSRRQGGGPGCHASPSPTVDGTLRANTQPRETPAATTPTTPTRACPHTSTTPRPPRRPTRRSHRAPGISFPAWHSPRPARQDRDCPRAPRISR